MSKLVQSFLRLARTDTNIRTKECLGSNKVQITIWVFKKPLFQNHRQTLQFCICFSIILNRCIDYIYNWWQFVILVIFASNANKFDVKLKIIFSLNVIQHISTLYFCSFFRELNMEKNFKNWKYHLINNKFNYKNYLCKIFNNLQWNLSNFGDCTSTILLHWNFILNLWLPPHLFTPSLKYWQLLWLFYPVWIWEDMKILQKLNYWNKWIFVSNGMLMLR